ncbi:hypothetical protein SPAR149_0173 [Streptococcus pneumoniae GA05578]|mgnify:CR=1 FL=1|nr:hypothetical protein SP670_0245 [Streptococcus pneumoniae 670-6B]EGI87080.1 hypothetical protein SPAR148_0151 [Streptococcus pneumoniae GA17545]EHD89313.1 hypothetical protein SPAR22_0160 [Streptococcus pneumoniae GA11304]EHE02690.1 hypothetical protein SPAR39_0180 [Streptococcus pneumoniae GA16242]EHE63078.1 hypothetical protein SPAR141_0150 [Streptococcus pneumoniae NP112]EHZ12530.1 hypothetical protein SPAR8_0146 [Streptococcus pneumoniae GA05248]EIA00655.1 hypothetical protein SPAR149_
MRFDKISPHRIKILNFIIEGEIKLKFKKKSLKPKKIRFVLGYNGGDK